MKLRKYQEEFVSNLSNTLRTSRKVCAQLATGGGKTIVFSAISKRYTDKSSKSVLILVHRQELLQQTRKTLFNVYGIDSFCIVAGVKYVPPAKVYLGMVESTNRRMVKIKNVGLVIIDECHIAVFNKMHKHFEEEYIIGFSATPLSSNKKEPLKNYYDQLVCGIDIPELIENKFLCQNITRAPKDVVDRNELSLKNGEFDEAQMSAAFSKPRYIHNTVTAYEKYSFNKKVIIFNVNISHSLEVKDAFMSAGYNCKHLDSYCNKEERLDVLKWFKETPDAILCNVGIATTGFDEPSIETVIINKAVMSMTLWLQMCGRGARATEMKSVFNIIDMGGNALTHGDWSQSRDWNGIFLNPPKPSDGNGIAPIRSCGNCEAIIPASQKICQYCGFEQPKKAVPVEQAISDFVILTKNIDPEKLLKENEDKKDYYVFFKMGNDLANAAKETIASLTDEYINFIVQKYYELGKEWAKKCKDKKRFNDWHKDQAKIHLYFQLKKNYPEWSPVEETYIKYLPKLTPFELKQNIDLKVIFEGNLFRIIKISDLLPFAQKHINGYSYEI